MVPPGKMTPEASQKRAGSEPKASRKRAGSEPAAHGVINAYFSKKTVIRILAALLAVIKGSQERVA